MICRYDSVSDLEGRPCQTLLTLRNFPNLHGGHYPQTQLQKHSFFGLVQMRLR